MGSATFIQLYQHKTIPIPTDETQIRQLMQQWANAVQAKDIKGVLAHHADDILMFDVVYPLQSKGIGLYCDSWVKDVFPWFMDDGKFELTGRHPSATPYQ